MNKITSAKCFRPLVALIIIFIMTAAVGSLTASIYANAFFYLAKGIIVSFCAFLVIDVLRWLERTALEENPRQTKAQEIGWTIAVLLFMGYFLWRRWYHYSVWQIWLTALVMALLLIGMLIRILGKWNADCVRWITWAASCLLVTAFIVVTIVVFKPLTIKEAEEIVHIETCDTSLSFYIIHSSKQKDAPLGYYEFHQMQEDGTSASYGSGIAVLYLGEGKEAWRTAEPGSRAEEGQKNGISVDGTVFTYSGIAHDVTQLAGFQYAGLVYNLRDFKQLGDRILVIGSMGKNADFYGVFNTETQEFEHEIAAAQLIYQEDDIQTAVYSFENSIYSYDGTLIKGLDLSESEYIYDISFDETGKQILVDVAIITSDELPRQEIISLP